MIKKYLKKILLATVLSTSSIYASDYTFESNSLVGIEAGFNRVSSEMTTTRKDYDKYKDNLGSFGLKIGGQTRNYRIYLSARYFVDTKDKFDYITTYGAEGQYIFNIFSGIDFFLGIEGGIVNIKFQVEDEALSRTLSDPYFGAGVGISFDVTDTAYFELGTKILNIDAINSNNNVSYQFNNIITAYMSLVIKYQMD